MAPPVFILTDETGLASEAAQETLALGKILQQALGASLQVLAVSSYTAQLALPLEQGYPGLKSRLQEGGTPIVLTPGGTAVAHNLLPRLAMALDGVLITDIRQVDTSAGLTVTKAGMAETVLNTYTLDLTRPILLSSRTRAFAASTQAEVDTVSLESLEFPFLAGSGEASSLTLVEKITENRKGNTAQLRLEDAAIVVAGGRGLGGPENFHWVEELAQAVHGAVGASRAIVDAGWRPHSEQVGQTGKSVSPSLYIALGISGAIQHQVGMRNSRRIIAINRDPDAPIFKLADVGVVGDVNTIVPAWLDAIKAAG